ncbi:coiled-coil domain-containing protein [Longispora albida]|uniref:coiled-coil domain-containing protein n=1 Tax=Longispora albida TaxID=203523 RepID=UPI0003A7FE83|nr:hypothetical protein [Longispora albida]
MVAVAGLLSVTPASAEPEGGTPALRSALSAASQRYQDARVKITESRKRQQELSTQITQTQGRVDALRKVVGLLAAEQYKGTGRGQLQVFLNSESLSGFLDTATLMRYLSMRDGKAVEDLRIEQGKLDEQRKQLDAAILVQDTELNALRKSQDEALKALRKAGGGDPTLGFGDLPANATPAPRNASGGFSSEGCTVKDPTTSGCLSPRTLHAYNEVRKAGFSRYTACYRSTEDGYEHPRGRACDFAAAPNGFSGQAYGGDKEYGNKLAAWLIGNSERLGVLYVIWYRQIWMPGMGWRSYSGYGGPSAEHTDHVHLSIR